MTRLISYIGKNTLAILLLHKFPILFFQVIFKFTKNSMANNNIVVILLIDIITMLMCCLANKIYKIIVKGKSVRIGVYTPEGEQTQRVG